MTDRVIGETVNLSDGSFWDINSELRDFAVDIIRGESPTTVLGTLEAQPDDYAQQGSRGHRSRQPLQIESIAGLTGKRIADVELIVDALEREDLIARIEQNGLPKIALFAYFSEKNGSDPLRGLRTPAVTPAV